MNNIAPFILGRCIYTLFDDGIANLLALDTLRHGTSVTSNVMIRIFGANPSFGGGEDTPSVHLEPERHTDGFFYVLKDAPPKISSIRDVLMNLLPKCHAAAAGAFTLYHPIAKFASSELGKILGVISGLFSLIFSPTIKFRVKPEEYSSLELENDPKYGDLAWRTKKRISPMRIGLIGTLFSNPIQGWSTRAKNNPTKVLTGIAELTALVAIAAFAIKNPPSTIPFCLGVISSC